MKPIYLASGSPRRKELLRQLIGDNFEIIKSNYEEDNDLDMSPVDLALHNSIEKGRDVVGKLEKGIVISADTFITFNNKVLGKPNTPENATKFLKEISGQTVEVFTGYVVIDVETKQEVQGCEITKVKIGDLTDTLIDSYIATEEPLDKAGSFGIQEKGAIIVENIDGCYFNVVGLPLYRLNKAFTKLGLSVFEYK